MGLMRQTPRVPTDPYDMPSYAQLFWSPTALATLSAGYLGSGVFGFLLVVSRHCLMWPHAKDVVLRLSVSRMGRARSS